MHLIDLITQDIKAAMLAKDKDKLDVLRAIKSALLIEATNKGAGGGEISKDVELKILQRLHKQRKESAEIYRTQGRPDLEKIEEQQAQIIETYLPQQITRDELMEKVQKIIKEVNAHDVKDIGKVMASASKKLAGKADNAAIAEMARQLLT